MPLKHAIGGGGCLRIRESSTYCFQRNLICTPCMHLFACHVDVPCQPWAECDSTGRGSTTSTQFERWKTTILFYWNWQLSYWKYSMKVPPFATKLCAFSFYYLHCTTCFGLHAGHLQVLFDNITMVIMVIKFHTKDWLILEVVDSLDRSSHMFLCSFCFQEFVWFPKYRAWWHSVYWNTWWRKSLWCATNAISTGSLAAQSSGCYECLQATCSTFHVQC
jgi:hypothetical protein